MQLKAYQPHNSDRVFTISQKYIFSVHQISTSGVQFNIFLARTRTESTAQNAPKHAIWSEKSIFSGKGIVPSPQIPLPVDGHSLTHTLPLVPTRPSGSTPHPPEFQPDLRDNHIVSGIACQQQMTLVAQADMTVNSMLLHTSHGTSVRSANSTSIVHNTDKQ